VNGLAPTFALGLGNVDFAAVKSASLGSIESLVRGWLPNGKRKGDEWVAINPTRHDKTSGSFSINLRTGVWSDFATGEVGADMIDLLAYLRGLSVLEAAKEVGETLGVSTTASVRSHALTPVPADKLSAVLAPAETSRDPECFPQRTPPDNEGKPHFVVAGEPPRRSDELRRHAYKVGTTAVRIKIIRTNGAGALNWYRVSDADGTSGWQLRKPNGFKDVPYIGFLDAFDRDPFDPDQSLKPLYWPEGEKDVETVTGKGALAFTFGGVGDGLPAGCEEYMRGRHVVILADNDAPGREHAEKKANLAASVAASVKVVHFTELKHKGDVSDFFQDGGSIEALEQIVALQVPYKPRNAPVPLDTVPADIRATPYVWVEPESIPLRDWLYGKHLIRKFVSATVAPGAVGKSSLVLAEALAMVSGKPLLGTSPPQKLRVWLWNLEDPIEETTRRVQATAKFYGLNPDDIGDRLFVDSGRDQSMVIATTRNGVSIVIPVIDKIIAEMLGHGIDVLIIDPFVSCHQLSENDNQAMDMVAKEWAKIADRTNCAIELVHHTRKQGGTEVEVTTESARGAKALTDACRSVRAVNRMTKEEGERAGLENHRSFFRVFKDKANLAPPADKSDWFELKSVDLGNGPGPFGDSIGVVASWEWPDHFADVSVADLRLVQAKVAGGKWRESPQSPEWVGYAVAGALRLDATSKIEKAKIRGLLKVW
jgi:AAA domain